MSHRSRLPSDAMTNAPLRVPTSTRTLLILYSFPSFAQVSWAPLLSSAPLYSRTGWLRIDTPDDKDAVGALVDSELLAGLHCGAALQPFVVREMTMEFAAEHDVPIPYMQRTRDYYLALGYGNPYRWAHFDAVPFTPLRRPLAQARVALITTAAPYQPGVGDQGPGAPYNAAAKFYTVYSDSADSVPDLRISHVGYDRKHTRAEDPNTWFPLARLQHAVKSGRIGALTPRFHGAPTNRSHRTTVETDAPELLRRCREDAADVAILVPT